LSELIYYLLFCLKFGIIVYLISNFK